MEIGFFFKKKIAYFMEPFGMVMALLVIGLYFLFVKKQSLAKFFLSLGFLVMFLYSYQPFSNFLVVNLEKQYPKYNYEHDIKYIHVLGNGHNTDEEQPLSSQISEASIRRDSEGIIIHLKTKESKLIFTGYEGWTNIATARMNANFAQAVGVEEENIIIDEDSKDTAEEAEFTKTIVGSEKFVLVTSAMHMPRAMLLFESLDLNPIAAPTNFYKEGYDFFSLPNLGNFGRSQLAMHEYIGLLWSKLKASI